MIIHKRVLVRTRPVRHRSPASLLPTALATAPVQVPPCTQTAPVNIYRQPLRAYNALVPPCAPNANIVWTNRTRRFPSRPSCAETRSQIIMRTRNKLQIRTPDLRQAATFEQATFEQATDATVFATEVTILHYRATTVPSARFQYHRSCVSESAARVCESAACSTRGNQCARNARHTVGTEPPSDRLLKNPRAHKGKKHGHTAGAPQLLRNCWPQAPTTHTRHILTASRA